MKHPVYVFDLDGTMVDSMPAWTEVMRGILDSCNADYPDNFIELFTPLGTAGTIDLLKNEWKLELKDEEILRMMDEGMVPMYETDIPLKEGVKQYLKEMKRLGHRLGVLTASPHSMLDVCLKRLGVFDMFEHVFSCDDFKASKSDIKIYDQLADRFGVKKEEIAFFDDNVNVIKTAKQAGVYAVGILDDSGRASHEEMKRTAECCFETMLGAPEV